MKEIKIATQMFNDGHACSQAVLAAFADRYGMPQEMALKLSCAFAGGYGGQGKTCGAVTGALMVLGLHAGRGLDCDDMDAKEQTNELVAKFLDRFQADHNTLICNELTGVVRTNLEAHAKAKEEGVYDRVCPGLVEHAAKIISELLTEQDPKADSSEHPE